MGDNEQPRIPRLQSRWETGEALLGAIRRDGGQWVLEYRLPENAPLPPKARVGALFSLVLELSDREADFHLHARIVEISELEARRTIFFEFLPAEDDRLDLLLSAARGESFSYVRRRFDRLEINLPVEIWLGKNDKIRTITNDISEGGVQVALTKPLPIDAIVSLTVTFPGGRRIRMTARIASVVRGGPNPGVGHEFLFESSRQQEDLQGQVSLLRAKAMQAS